MYSIDYLVNFFIFQLHLLNVILFYNRIFIYFFRINGLYDIFSIFRISKLINSYFRYYIADIIFNGKKTKKKIKKLLTYTCTLINVRGLRKVQLILFTEA